MYRQDPLQSTYAELPDGRDAYMVAVVGTWIEQALRSVLGRFNGRGARPRVIDVGCGAQPFRSLVEELGARYVGFDIAQNPQAPVDIIGFIDRPLPEPWPDDSRTYDLVLCTEVLEHVPHLEAAFANLRTLVAPGGKIVITIPFVFPLHMEPVDFHRVTPYAIEQYALAHGFVVDACVRLGNPADVIATMLDDVSFLPKDRGLLSRLAARVFRISTRAFRRLLRSRAGRRLVHLNSNAYLSNGVILSPKTPAAGS